MKVYEATFGAFGDDDEGTICVVAVSMTDACQDISAVLSSNQELRAITLVGDNVRITEMAEKRHQRRKEVSK